MTTLLAFAEAFDVLMFKLGFTPIGRDELGYIWSPDDYKPILNTIERDLPLVTSSNSVQ